MNKLKTVTISGADDNVAIADLLALSAKYPFVEWGILLSAKSHGKPRYPKMEWLMDIGMTSHNKIRKSVHLCGEYARFFACGQNESPNSDIKDLIDVLDDFDRVQINLGGKTEKVDIDWLAHNIFESMEAEYIFQLRDDSAQSREFIDKINVALLNLGGAGRVYPFLDASGGHGVEEKNWQMNLSINHLRGFAGGINPTNVESIVKEISAKLPDGEKFWIDMESGVRTDDNFDLKLVQDVLEACQPFVVG